MIMPRGVAELDIGRQQGPDERALRQFAGVDTPIAGSCGRAVRIDASTGVQQRFDRPGELRLRTRRDDQGECCGQAWNKTCQHTWTRERSRESACRKTRARWVDGESDTRPLNR